ncbi:MAG: ABC transporter permease [Chloroflexi bacterium]|nr:MAG: ABC transporter permease [Chloroflexota bacterium]RLT29756.1 MAG: ABC transporter permease [Chloroflexota bacterium]
MTRLRKLLATIRLPAISVLVALLVGAIVIMLSDLEVLGKIPQDPLGAIVLGVQRVYLAYTSLLMGAFGDPAKFGKAIAAGGDAVLWAKAFRPITETLLASVPLMFVGLAVMVSFRTGVFNIGGEGQFMMGALGGTIAAIVLGGAGLPTPITILGVVALGALFGAAWAFIPGILKARVGASEVITTIMLNYIANLFIFFLLVNWELIQREDRTQPISKALDKFVVIPTILPIEALRLHLGFIVALLLAVVVSWFLWRTAKGFELRAAGLNLPAARYAGMGAASSVVIAMLISGAIAGIGGAFEVVGTVKQLTTAISGGVGFTAIAIALVGGTRPSGVVATSLVFGALRNGGALMGLNTGIPIDLLFFIQALVIMFIAAPSLTQRLIRSPFKRRVKEATA